MDTENTKAAWQSRAVFVPLVGLAAFWANRTFGVLLPPDIQGYLADTMPVVLTAAVALGAWFRVKARTIIDRWL